MRSSISGSERGPGAFLLRVALFVGVVLVLLFGCLLFGPPASPSEYMASTVLKNQALDRASSPKVVLLGGSNLAYGMDSEQLSRTLCRPVINMGLAAPLGFLFITNEAKGRLDKGDLVVLALEEEFYAQPERIEDVTIAVVDNRPRSLAFVPVLDRPRVIIDLLVMRLKAVKDYLVEVKGSGWGKRVYRKREFNAHGDLVNHLEEPIPEVLWPENNHQDPVVLDPSFWRIAREFVDAAHSAGAEVVFSWPSIAASQYHHSNSTAILIEIQAHGLRTIGDPADYVFPDSLFFESHYHLHRTGRQLRTDRLLKDLCSQLDALCCETE